MTDRALSPVVGVVCLLAVTVLLAAVVGASATVQPPSSPTAASFEATAELPGEITILHRGGDTIDPTAMDLRVYIEGEPLDRQPPVPFFSARGFESGPTGPFNSATSTKWRAGEAASFTLAGTNGPSMRSGDSVTIEIFVDEQRVAQLEATA
ncbi:MAG: type IV pilin N-terminal domain-containing protein [Halobacteriota archaeon]